MLEEGKSEIFFFANIDGVCSWVVVVVAEEKRKWEFDLVLELVVVFVYIYIQYFLEFSSFYFDTFFPRCSSQRSLNILASSSSVVTKRPPFARVVVIVVTLS